MKTTLLCVLFAFALLSCGGESANERAKRILKNDSLTLLAIEHVKGGRIDTAALLLKPLVIQEPFYDQDAGIVLKEITQYNSIPYMDSAFEKFTRVEYNAMMKNKDFSKMYFVTPKLNSFFMQKLKDNHKRGLDIIKNQEQLKKQEIEQAEARAKNLESDMASERKSYETKLRNSFLDNGLDIEVKVSGKNNTKLTLSYALFNAVWARKMQTEGFLDKFRDQGFKKVVITDNYNYEVYWDF